MAASHPTGDHHASTQQDALLLLAILAALATAILTAASFWLSYEHLHDLAATHGLAGANSRAWAWPATVDLFIVIGEILMLRASLARQGLPLAIGLTAAGSGGSIALNIAAVGTGHPPMDYVVAAVPPVAALLAFGALMWQVHDWIDNRTTAPAPAPAITAPAAPTAPVLPPPPTRPASVPVKPASKPVRAPANTSSSDPDTDAAKAAIRALYNDGTRPGSKLMQRTVRQELGLDKDPAGSTVRFWRRGIEKREPELKDYPAAIA